ncbi:MAG: helix-turn-helix domain-containing protein [Candidatus Dormibacteria bacterium]
MPQARRRWKKPDANNQRGRVAVRFRACPTADQETKVRRIGGCCRVVRNLAKEQRDLAYQLTGKSPGYTAQTADLKELRDDPEVAPWLAEAPSQVLQQAIKDTDTAYTSGSSPVSPGTQHGLGAAGA